MTNAKVMSIDNYEAIKINSFGGVYVDCVWNRTIQIYYTMSCSVFIYSVTAALLYYVFILIVFIYLLDSHNPTISSSENKLVIPHISFDNKPP